MADFSHSRAISAPFREADPAPNPIDTPSRQGYNRAVASKCSWTRKGGTQVFYDPERLLFMGKPLIRAGVLSDTHLNGFSEGGALLERLAERYFRDTEVILHAGDLVDPDVLLGLADRKVYLVRGNLDPPQRGVPQRRIIELGGFRIGLIHGWGAPQGLAEKVLRAFHGEELDCLVFGHSHYPCCERREGVLLFNPGSPTDRRQAPWHSVGVLELGETIEGRIINIDAD